MMDVAKLCMYSCKIVHVISQNESVGQAALLQPARRLPVYFTPQKRARPMIFMVLDVRGVGDKLHPASAKLST